MPAAGRTPPKPISVRGGVTEIDVDYHDLLVMAAAFGTAGRECGSVVLDLVRLTDDPDLEASAPFDHAGYSDFTDALSDAVSIWTGLGAAVGAAQQFDHELRRTVFLYGHLDQVFGDGAPDWLVGIVKMPGALVAGVGTLAGTGSLSRGENVMFTLDPEFGDAAVTLWGNTLARIERALPDGHGVVCNPGLDSSGVAGRAPRTLTDIVGDLAQRDDDSRHGEIDVRILTMADGSRRAIVDVTGTKSWTPLPTDDVTNLITNERALVGMDTAYEQGVLAAMRQAGVRKGDNVMIVGHSQGGMIAVDAARDADRSGEFNVTHVITAGAPVGKTVGQLPSRVKVLALENKRDLVPHLDGDRNPDKTNITTVTGNRGDGSIGDDHSLRDSYLPITADTQASDDIAVTQYIKGARGYLRAEGVTTHTYQIQRRY